jgi:anaerobic magnesium-protoporphyrin IX monomethyl ester cyclase
MANVLLLFPPFSGYAFGEEWRGSESLTPPLGLLYLATPLAAHGHRVRLLDLSIERLERQQFVDVVAAQDFVLVSCYTQSLAHVDQLIEDVRRIQPKAFVLCGGPYCRETKRYIRGSDLTCVGEADRTIVTMVERLRAGEPLRDILDLAYEQAGEVVRTEPAAEEGFPEGQYPMLELTQGKAYGYFQGVRIPRVAPLLTSRGCPFRCTFCTWNFVKYRERPVADVLAEIELRVRQGYRILVLCDDNFLKSRARVHAILDGIIARRLRVRMIVQGRVDTADEGLYRKMRRAGVLAVIFGIESANPDVLRLYNKRTTVDAVRRAVQLADRAGLITVGSFIIGAPIETLEHFRRDRVFAERIPLDFLNVNVLSYFYGSGIWKDARAKGLLDEGDLFVLANEKLSSFTQEELETEEREWLGEFYRNPRRVARILWKMVTLGESRVLLTVARHFLRRSERMTGGSRYGFVEGTVRVAAA